MATYNNNLQDQITFLKTNLNILPTSRGLDIGCGRGEQMIELQKYCANTFGVDIENNSEITNFIHLDIIHSKLSLKNLDFAYCITPYFGKDWWNLDVFLSNISESLKQGGLFCFDLNNFNSFKIGKKILSFKDTGDKIVLNTLIRESDKAVGTRTFVEKDWSRSGIDLLWRIFTKTEIENIFLNYGLKICSEFSGFDSGVDVNWEPNIQEKRIIVIFEKI